MIAYSLGAKTRSSTGSHSWREISLLRLFDDGIDCTLVISTRSYKKEGNLKQVRVEVKTVVGSILCTSALIEQTVDIYSGRSRKTWRPSKSHTSCDPSNRFVKLRTSAMKRKTSLSDW